MKLATLLTDSGPHLAALVGDQLVNLSTADPSLPKSMRSLLAAGRDAIAKAAAIASHATTSIPLADANFLPPVTDPTKILCLGLNYRDHARETNAAIPTEPVVFGKFPNALIAHGDTIVLPKVSSRVDYEAELVIVVGQRGKHIPAESAMDYVAGYTVGHDVSARDWQFKGEKQWLTGKSFDTFAPTGPFLVTKDEVPDPHALGIRLRLNGQTMQDGNTRELIFNIPTTIAYLSQVFTLEPGDLIFTGTPPGVGVARKPQVFLKDGDVAEVEIDHLGVLRNPIRQEA